MNNLNHAYNKVTSIGQYSREYFSYLGKVLESIDEKEINKLGEVFENARENGNTYPGIYDPLGQYLFAGVTFQF